MSGKREKFNKKLLVEGIDDQHVIWALCEKFKLAESFVVIDCKGIDPLFEEIPLRLKESELTTLGIIVDADTDVNKRWTKLRNILINHEFKVEIQLPTTGLMCKNVDGKTVGVWLMPNNDHNGMLEDFIAFLVPNDDKLLPIVNVTLDNIEAQNINKYLLAHRSKAAIHTWLSWQENPGTPMGLSIKKRYLTTDNEICFTFVNWLKELFG